MKKVGIGIKIVVIVLLCFIFFINISFMVSRVILHQEMPSVAGFSEAVVLSGSMEPTFSPGDMVIYREESSYKVGDVVAFSDGSAVTTHRIVGMDGDSFTTKGDANNTEDQAAIDESQIYGKMIAVIPNIGNIMLWLRTPFGLLVLFVIAMVLLFGEGFVRDIKGSKREKIEEDD